MESNDSMKLATSAMMSTCEVDIRFCIDGINRGHSLRVAMQTSLHEVTSLVYPKPIRTNRVGFVRSRGSPYPIEEAQTVDKLIYLYGYLSGLQSLLILFYVSKRVADQ